MAYLRVAVIRKYSGKQINCSLDRILSLIRLPQYAGADIIELGIPLDVNLIKELKIQ